MPMTNGKSASAVQVRILGDASAFGEALRSDLKAAHSMSVAVAFAKESALEVLDVEDWCRSGRSLKFLAGTDFALTELDLLKRLSNAPTAECKIYDSLSLSLSLGKNRVFHPKLYVLEKAESKVVYVGSSNFTRGGLRANIEANVRLEGPAEASEVDDATRLLARCSGASMRLRSILNSSGVTKNCSASCAAFRSIRRLRDMRKICSSRSLFCSASTAPAFPTSGGSWLLRPRILRRAFASAFGAGSASPRSLHILAVMFSFFI